jgi:hypothetical protein
LVVDQFPASFVLVQFVPLFQDNLTKGLLSKPLLSSFPLQMTSIPVISAPEGTPKSHVYQECQSTSPDAVLFSYAKLPSSE